MALNATSVGVGRRNRFFLCMCSRNCISVIISVDIVFPIVMVMCQNCQVMVISFGCCWYRRGGGGGSTPRVLIVGVPATSGERWMREDGAPLFSIVMMSDFLMEFFLFGGGCLGKVTGSRMEVVLVKKVVEVVERVF